MDQHAARSDYGISDLATNEFYQVQTFDGLYVCDKPGLSGYLVCLVHLVSFMHPNKPNRPNEQDRLADFFSILRDFTVMVTPIQKYGISVPILSQASDS